MAEKKLLVDPSEKTNHWRQKDISFNAHQRAHDWRDVTRHQIFLVRTNAPTFRRMSPGQRPPNYFITQPMYPKNIHLQKTRSPSTRVAWLTKEKNQKKKMTNSQKKMLKSFCK